MYQGFVVIYVLHYTLTVQFVQPLDELVHHELSRQASAVLQRRQAQLGRLWLGMRLTTRQLSVLHRRRKGTSFIIIAGPALMEPEPGRADGNALLLQPGQLQTGAHCQGDY